MQFAAKVSKQLVRIQKTWLNNAFDTQALWQEQSDRAARVILDQASWMHDSGRQLWDRWAADLKTGQATLKTLLNTHFDMLDGILTHQDTQS
jgi:hypothetical protein